MRALRLRTTGHIEGVEVENDTFEMGNLIDADFTERVCVMRTDSMNLCLVVDESGQYRAKQWNPVASDLYGYKQHGIPIVGDVLVVAETMTIGGPDYVDCDYDTLRDMMTETLRAKGHPFP